MILIFVIATAAAVIISLFSRLTATSAGDLYARVTQTTSVLGSFVEATDSIMSGLMGLGKISKAYRPAKRSTVWDDMGRSYDPMDVPF